MKQKTLLSPSFGDICFQLQEAVLDGYKLSDKVNEYPSQAYQYEAIVYKAEDKPVAKTKAHDIMDELTTSARKTKK